MKIGLDRSRPVTMVRIGNTRLSFDCVTWGGPNADWYYFGIERLTKYQIEHEGRWGFGGMYYDGPHWWFALRFFRIVWSLPNSTCSGLM